MKWRTWGSLLLLPIAAWVLLALLDWLPVIPAEQRRALARLRVEPPPLPGRNATLYAWLVDREVPDDEWPRWLALAEVEAQAGLAAMAGGDAWPAAFRDCVSRGGNGCLARVREDTAAARALREAQAQRLRRIEWVQRQTRHLAAIGPRTLHQPLPPLGALHAPVRLDVALRFLDGDRAGALGRLCQHALWWRSLRRDTDQLIGAMVGTSVLEGAGESYAEMLQALPPGEAPPSACEAAFAPPVAAERDLCRPMRGEFLMMEAAMHGATAATGEEGLLSRLSRRLMYRPEAAAALQAPAYDYWCGAAQRAAAAARAPARMTPPGRCRIDGWAFNAFGCVLSQIAAPTLPGHYQRLLEWDSRMRLVASAVWLRQHGGEDPAAAFAQRPATMRDPRHAVGGARCAPRLVFDPTGGGRAGPSWHLPLAPPADCPPPEPTP